MNLTLLIICCLIVLCLVFITVFILKYNDFQFVIIKISEAENNIHILLEKKCELFDRAIPIIKENSTKYKDDEIFDSLLKIKNKKLNSFDLNDEIKKLEKEFVEIIDFDKSLLIIESLNSVRFEMTEVENDLSAAIKYYNENVVSYNKLVRCFPSNMVGLVMKMKHKEFYSEEKEEIFEILKKK